MNRPMTTQELMRLTNEEFAEYAERAASDRDPAKRNDRADLAKLIREAHRRQDMDTIYELAGVLYM